MLISDSIDMLKTAQSVANSVAFVPGTLTKFYHEGSIYYIIAAYWKEYKPQNVRKASICFVTVLPGKHNRVVPEGIDLENASYEDFLKIWDQNVSSKFAFYKLGNRKPYILDLESVEYKPDNWERLLNGNEVEEILKNENYLPVHSDGWYSRPYGYLKRNDM